MPVIKTFLKRWLSYVKVTFKELYRVPTVAYSAQAAFFMIVSVFPMIMLLLSLLRFLPINFDHIRDLVMSNIPDALKAFVQNVANELFSRPASTLVSITAITLVWSASAGMMALIRGLNAVYNTKDNRNYFIVRLLAIAYTLGFIVIVCVTLILLVFGNSIMNVVVGYLPSFEFFAALIKALRYVVMFVILTLYFAAMFTVLPKGRLKFRYQLPGAVVAAVGWMGFSYGYSLYIQFVMTASSPVYGSLSAVVFIMLWLYFCMFILFVGAGFNNALDMCRKAKKLAAKENVTEGLQQNGREET